MESPGSRRKETRRHDAFTFRQGSPSSQPSTVEGEKAGIGVDLKSAPAMGEGVAGGRAATRAAPTMAETGGKKSPPANRRGASGVAYLVLVALVIMPSLGRWQALGACYAGFSGGALRRAWLPRLPRPRWQ